MTALSSRNGWRLPRALVGSAALYALVLQALLGLAATPPMAAPFAAACLPSVSAQGEAPSEPSGHDATLHDAALAACCLGAACAGGLVVRPAEAIPAAWPARSTSGLAWPEAGRPGARATLLGAARARAPPVT